MSDTDIPATEAAGENPTLHEFLYRNGLAEPGMRVTWAPLTGGVSSEIWQVDLPTGSLCVKRALPQLKVAGLWEAPTSRNAVEWEWLRFAAAHAPDAVPHPLAHDPELGMFAMSFLDPVDYPVWKRQLLDGVAVPATARAVGEILGKLHAASAGDAGIAKAFQTTDNFYALRLEPYLLATARRHPDLGRQLSALVERTGEARIALVHGDVSPKNILIGARGPVILDAECAWYGDPAFDLAFCLNHFLLKCLANPGATDGFLACFRELSAAYLERVDWQDGEEVEARAATLLPALLLARIDGKSPVEYLTDETQKSLVREVARWFIVHAPQRLSDVMEEWQRRVATP